VTKKVARTKFKINELPLGVLIIARESDQDLETFVSDVEFEYPNVAITRENARSVLDYVSREATLDRVAGLQVNNEPTSRMIDDAIYQEVSRLTNEVKVLNKIAMGSPETNVRIKSSGEVINSAMARDRLVLTMSSLTHYKKVIADSAPKEGNTGGGINMNFNIGSMMSDGLQRIKENAPIDAEVIKVQ